MNQTKAFEKVQKLFEFSTKEDDLGNASSSFSSYLELENLLSDFEEQEKNSRCKKIIETQKDFVSERIVYLKKFKSQKGSSNYLFCQQTLALYCKEKGAEYDLCKEYQKSLDWYTLSSEIYLNVLKIKPNDKDTKQDVILMLNRGEELKKLIKLTSQAPEKQVVTSSLTQKEINVLKETSSIHGFMFLPWIEEIDSKFESNTLFQDLDGFLKLSPNQINSFQEWRRAYSLLDYSMLKDISPDFVTQSIISDCSFIASLCVASVYEKKFKKKLVSNLIYPQKNGVPVINKYGKYHIKLFFNGIQRKVVIDDYLPYSFDGGLLCSYSKNKELWVSLLEKAYMKLNGGYSFLGSNSGIDLYTLTGWIPEEVKIQSKEFDPIVIWKKLLDGHRFGHCLCTISTGNIDDDSGLISNHAYAILDIKEVYGEHMLQIKNPWNKTKWNGKFSREKEWSKDLLRELKIDKNYFSQDNGVFWIDFGTLCKMFQSLHFSWNTDIFQNKIIYHEKWNMDELPLVLNDTYNVSYNPQFHLKTKGMTWIMLTNHKTSKQNNQFITVHVYKGKSRIYFKENAFIEGTYSNDPHYLICLKESNDYVIVISQYQKIQPIYFSIHALSNSPLVLDQVGKYLYSNQIKDEFNEKNSGGSVNLSTYSMNPQYEIIIKKDSNLIIKLEMNQVYPLNILVANNQGKRVLYPTKTSILSSSGNYRPSFCYCFMENVRAGSLTIILSTFNRNQFGSFILKVESNNSPIQIIRL